MKKLLLITAIILCLVNCQSKKSPESKVKKDTNIVIGQKDTVYSDILKEYREIWVHLPKSARNTTTGSAKYPVVYLLDGSAHFYSVTGMIKQLSTTNGNTISPEMIVIGIPNTDRIRDLTPTHVNEFNGDSIPFRTSGGGKNFLSFIEKELIPHVQKSYPASSYRTFIGHSLGGLVVIDALVDRPDLFDNYIAIDPSLWWDNQKLLKRVEGIFKTNTYTGKSLYLGVANTLGAGIDFNEVQNDTTEDTKHIRSIIEFAKTTESIPDNGLNFKWKYYANDSHSSVPLITEYDAIHFLFPWYELKGLDQFFDPNSTATTDDLISFLDAHYKTISNNFGYNVLPPESFINNLGYTFNDNPNTLDKAHALFNLNIQNYPNSSKVYDSMGDCYLAQQDSIKALEFFTKALKVGKNEYSQKKIDLLKK